MKKELFTYIVLNALCVSGALIGNFIGGFLFGMGISLIVVVTLGKWQLRKASYRIDSLQKNHSSLKQTEL